MPCGGIYSERFSPIPFAGFEKTECWECGTMITTQNPPLFVLEWDAFIHYGCLAKFLSSDEGMIVLHHEHDILIEFSWRSAEP